MMSLEVLLTLVVFFYSGIRQYVLQWKYRLKKLVLFVEVWLWWKLIFSFSFRQLSEVNPERKWELLLGCGRSEEIKKCIWLEKAVKFSVQSRCLLQILYTCSFDIWKDLIVRVILHLLSRWNRLTRAMYFLHNVGGILGDLVCHN